MFQRIIAERARLRMAEVDLIDVIAALLQQSANGIRHAALREDAHGIAMLQVHQHRIGHANRLARARSADDQGVVVHLRAARIHREHRLRPCAKREYIIFNASICFHHQHVLSHIRYDFNPAPSSEQIP